MYILYIIYILKNYKKKKKINLKKLHLDEL